jgi:spoIIIJ-associated protein
MRSIETEAKTVEEAITIACEKLNTKKDKLHIEILESAKGGLLSFFSGKKVRIKASLSEQLPKHNNNDDDLDNLKKILETIVKKIYSEASVDIKNGHEETVLNIIGNGSGIFIGKNGQTLEAFQYIMNKIKMNKFRNAPHIVVDSEAYRSRHVESLTLLAKRLSGKAKKRKAPVATEPLKPGDRRIVHMALKKDAELTTWSKGEGILKKVIIAPKN